MQKFRKELIQSRHNLHIVCFDENNEFHWLEYLFAIYSILLSEIYCQLKNCNMIGQEKLQSPRFCAPVFTSIYKFDCKLYFNLIDISSYRLFDNSDLILILKNIFLLISNPLIQLTNLIANIILNLIDISDQPLQMFA